ncbi:MAG: hypothetical protein K6T81_01400 [Alicyclobacillus macrosporangiidus]|uniref:hypothetical protein n=1 Tax=Alicyclobacillus macrosporangiidus TaxID=392015 RepID=UPI0026F31232|nr:hypothetical protein [Alicyclobacillus macrosporangiidus]MCL6597377.1 hypothetical protein [Alicyclobacillus macrosporangiidus]
MRRTQPWIGWLPVAFVAAAILNFAAGAALGGLMALVPELWGSLGPVHGEINPYGWLTMLIYGMTYAVLSVSAGLRLPWRWLGWLQWGIAEAGVLAAAAGMALPAHGLLLAGLWLQALAPTLFLINILSAVASRRKGMGRSEPAIPQALRYMAKSPRFQATDRIGQRGTDIALMLFVLATWWAALGATAGRPADGSALILLVGYGWIAGTVLAVAIHLYPRLTDDEGVPPWTVFTSQALWLAGVALATAGQAAWPPALAVGQRLLGVSFALTAGVYLIRLPRRRRDAEGERRMPSHAAWSWAIAWGFAGVLGLALCTGLSPVSLAGLHLLFLGWITTLVYAVGYALFPVLLEASPPSPRWAVPQIAVAAVGALCMILAFGAGDVSPRPAWLNAGMNGLFAAGGSCTWLAFAGFAAVWLRAMVCDTVHTPDHVRSG